MKTFFKMTFSALGFIFMNLIIPLLKGALTVALVGIKLMFLMMISIIFSAE